MWVRWIAITFALLLILVDVLCAFSPPDYKGEDPNKDQTQKQLSREKLSEEKSHIIVQTGRISIIVKNRPLKWVLKEISSQSGVTIIHSEDVASQKVSIELKDIPLDQGLQQILKDHDTFFFFGTERTNGKGGSNGKQSRAVLKKVWIYQKGDGHRFEPVTPQISYISVSSSPELPEKGAEVSLLPSEKCIDSDDLKVGLTHSDPQERAMAIQLLVEQMGEQALDDVLLALTDREEQVRDVALSVALNFGLPLPASLLADLSQYDSSPTVRFLALGALMNNIGYSPAQDQNIRTIAGFALSDSSPLVQEQGRQIIEQLDYPALPLETGQQEGQ